MSKNGIIIATCAEITGYLFNNVYKKTQHCMYFVSNTVHMEIRTVFDVQLVTCVRRIWEDHQQVLMS